MNIEKIVKDSLKGTLLGDYVNDADDLKTVELQDIAHQNADGSEHVIYYSKAHQLIADSNCEDVDEAEAMIRDFSGEFKSYDETATMIAYWLMRNKVYNQLLAEVELIIERLDQVNLEEISEFIDEIPTF